MTHLRSVRPFATTLLSLILATVTSSSGASSNPTGRRASTPREPDRARVNRAYGRLPLGFEENRGQTDARVAFLSRGHGYEVFLTPTQTTLVLRQPSAPTSAAGSQPPTIVRMQLIGANPGAPSAGLEELPGKVNYFIGDDPARWRTNVRTYARVEQRDVYPGVDMVHRGNQRRLEYDFVVAPGADPRVIRMTFTGIQDMHLEPGGDLMLMTAAGAIRQHKPDIYQEKAGGKQAIEGGYVLRGAGEVGFRLGLYDDHAPLVIDPVLVYSTYLGGTADDEGHGIAVDAFGNAYVTGQTHSSGIAFPQLNPLPPPAGGYGGWEVFVTKLNAEGNSVVYSTFLGGFQSDYGHAIAVDSLGQAYVTGLTRSENFPTTAGGYQRTINDVHHSAFVSKLNAEGNGLLYSTFLAGNTPFIAGGFALQEGQGIAVDSAGHAYVTGSTTAVDFPTRNPYQAAHGGGEDAFVTKLDTAASGEASLVYSTYLGGGRIDQGHAIAVDAMGHAYVTGTTDSGPDAPFPTASAFQPTLAGATDAFVSKLDTTASGNASLIYSTYLGGSNNENPNTPSPGGIAVDSMGAVYVTGSTNSWSSTSKPFPTTPGAYKTTLSNGQIDAFLTKMDPEGIALAYSTFLGGAGRDDGFGVAVDAMGHAYVTGLTESIDFPAKDAFQPVFGGGTHDAFVTKLDPEASGEASLVYSTFLGGDRPDRGFAVAVDATGAAYVTGETSSSTFPTTPGALDTSFSGPTDAFVTRIEGPGRPDLPAPDLVVTALSNPPALVLPRGRFAITDTVDNQGTGPAGATSTGYYLSLDTMKDPGDKAFGKQRSVPALASGEASTGTVTVTVAANTPLGDYYLLACADATTLVDEIDETNNCRASATLVTVTHPHPHGH